ncbi:MAG: hypothetical protein WCO75_08495, partial [Planctomycetota bacterium]
SELGPDVMASVLHMWRHGDVRARSQDETQATRARKLSKSDAWVDLSMDAQRVRARINGLNPWPGCAMQIDGVPMQVRRCEVVATAGCAAVASAPAAEMAPAGTLSPDGILICGTGAIRILEVQAAGGRTMPFSAWAHGARFLTSVSVTSAAPAAES